MLLSIQNIVRSTNCWRNLLLLISWFWRNKEDLARVFCNSIDFLCRFYVFLHLNLLNFDKITKLTTVNFFNSWYSLQCFDSYWHSLYLWFILSILRFSVDIYYPTLLSIRKYDRWMPRTLEIVIEILVNSRSFQDGVWKCKYKVMVSIFKRNCS